VGSAQFLLALDLLGYELEPERLLSEATIAEGWTMAVLAIEASPGTGNSSIATLRKKEMTTAGRAPRSRRKPQKPHGFLPREVSCK